MARDDVSQAIRSRESVVPGRGTINRALHMGSALVSSSPEGTDENSPAIHRWGGIETRSSPARTAESSVKLPPLICSVLWAIRPNEENFLWNLGIDLTRCPLKRSTSPDHCDSWTANNTRPVDHRRREHIAHCVVNVTVIVSS